jgi:hypothetical protein
MEDNVGFRINRPKEPIRLAIDFQDRFIKRELVRKPADSWFEIGLFGPVMDF